MFLKPEDYIEIEKMKKAQQKQTKKLMKQNFVVEDSPTIIVQNNDRAIYQGAGMIVGTMIGLSL